MTKRTGDGRRIHTQMLALFGEREGICKDCAHLTQNQYGFYKCKASLSDRMYSASDWRKSWKACGKFTATLVEVKAGKMDLDTLREALAATSEPMPDMDEMDALGDRALAGDDEATRLICGTCCYFQGDQKHCQPHNVPAGRITSPCTFAKARKHALEADGKTEADRLTLRGTPHA